MEPWALGTRKVRELEQELSVVLDDADCRAASFTREGQRRREPKAGAREGEAGAREFVGVCLLGVQGRSEGVGGRRARSRVKAGAV